MITYQKIQSYWYSTVLIYELIRQFQAQGYRNLVIPSRGVCPIIMAAKTYHHQKMKHECSMFDDRKERLQWRNAEFSSLPTTGNIWLPFTAQTGNKEEDENTYQIRLNWCKVLKSILSNNSTVNSIAYHVLTDTVGKGYGHTRSLIVRESPFLLIDTVVSGRAATEIAKALEEIELTNYKMILAVDAKGKKLQKEYKSQLFGKYSDRIEMVYFEDLFTEDQGPNYTEVFGVVYPNLTQALRSEFSDPSIAVGSLHMENGRDVLCKSDRIKFENYKRENAQDFNVQAFRNLFQCNECQRLGRAYNASIGLFSQLLFNFGWDELYKTDSSEIISRNLDQLITNINTYKFSDTSTTLKLFEKTTPLSIKTFNEVSSSHVIRCNMEIHDIETILQKIKNNTTSYQDQYRD